MQLTFVHASFLQNYWNYHEQNQMALPLPSLTYLQQNNLVIDDNDKSFLIKISEIQSERTFHTEI